MNNIAFSERPLVHESSLTSFNILFIRDMRLALDMIDALCMRELPKLIHVAPVLYDLMLACLLVLPSILINLHSGVGV